ncbi:hypothetical protein, partial [Mycobacterium tuberculosis]|uniref:non-homologous end-joining DNA ligase LigD n=1 Tax=Mycobacterium tuberculosis TaxID=1773 RepID=UPI003F4A9C55
MVVFEPLFWLQSTNTFPVTSGSKGLHLYTPLDEPVSSRGATVLAKRVAQRLEQAMP